MVACTSETRKFRSHPDEHSLDPPPLHDSKLFTTSFRNPTLSPLPIINSLQPGILNLGPVIHPQPTASNVSIPIPPHLYRNTANLEQVYRYPPPSITPDIRAPYLHPISHLKMRTKTNSRKACRQTSYLDPCSLAYKRCSVRTRA